MKRITTVILTAFSAFALSFSASSYADNTDSDGFIVFEAQPTATEQASSAPKVIKETKKAVKKAKEQPKKKAQKPAKRVVRKKRSTRKTRSKRSTRASTYRVRRGDTLYRISIKTGVKLSRLIRLNKLQGSKKHNIQAGQRLRLR